MEVVGNPTACWKAGSRAQGRDRVADANWLFGLTAQSYHLLRLGGMVPDALIVGIVRSGVEEDTREGSAVGAERAFDLTPTRNVDEERRYRGEYKRDVRTGGGAAFLRVLIEELIPDIEARYRANGDRTLVGYSMGGLFGAYVLFQSPETFKRMVLVSPSLWWDGGVIAKHEQTYAEKHKDLRVRLFMSDGERETNSMIGTMRQLEDRLASRRYEGLRLDTRIFESESHLSTFPVAVTRGLTTVFAEPSKP